MRKWGWCLRGQLQVWIEQHLKLGRHKFDVHPLTFWGSEIQPRNDNNDAQVHNIWNRFHGKLYVALVFPSPGIFIRRRARLVAMRRRNAESSMRHLPMCQVSWLYWACAMAPTVQSTHRAEFWFITGTKVCTSELVQDDNAQTCMQLVGGKLLSSPLHGDLKPQLNW